MQALSRQSEREKRVWSGWKKIMASSHWYRAETADSQGDARRHASDAQSLEVHYPAYHHWACGGPWGLWVPPVSVPLLSPSLPHHLPPCSLSCWRWRTRERSHHYTPHISKCVTVQPFRQNTDHLKWEIYGVQHEKAKTGFNSYGHFFTGVIMCILSGKMCIHVKTVKQY